jgi:hypothetical protein
MDTVIRPPVPKRKALDNDERNMMFIRQFNSVIEGVIPSGTTGTGHPVNDVRSISIQRFVVTVNTPNVDHCNASSDRVSLPSLNTRW